MQKVGLFFGSFNPIHTGHLWIAAYLYDAANLDEVWFVVTPQNPFKINEELLSENYRLELIQLAIQGDKRLKTCAIECNLPKPSYTYKTLLELRKIYPEIAFEVIIGGDNFLLFDRWKNWEEILDNHQLLVYRRPGYADHSELIKRNNVHVFDVPLLDVSSSLVRDNIRNGKSIKYLIPEIVIEKINQMKWYL